MEGGRSEPEPVQSAEMGPGLLTPIDSDTHVASSMSGSLLIFLSSALVTSPFMLLRGRSLSWLIGDVNCLTHTHEPDKAEFCI